MHFSLAETKVKVINVNPRAELHGEEPKPACDIKLEAKLANDCLAQFHPTLKGMLYVKDAEQADLVSGHDPNHMTKLRFEQLGTPLKWDGEVVGAEVVVHYGVTEKSHIKLGGCLVNEFRIEPQEGGTVVLTCRVQSHPDEKQMGRLAMMIGTEIEVSITPPAEDDSSGEE